MPRRRASRALYLTWRNARGPGWTKRARVYAAVEGQDWRVHVEDEHYGGNIFVPGRVAARALVDRFAAGATAKELLDERDARDA